MTEISIESIQNRFVGTSWPDFIELSSDHHKISLSLYIPASVHWFEGHFPEQPVLAGVVQTHWAVKIGQYCFSITDGFQQLSNIKFQTVILPNTPLNLDLHLNSKGSGFRFSYYNNEHQFSEGKISFRKK